MYHSPSTSPSNFPPTSPAASPTSLTWAGRRTCANGLRLLLLAGSASAWMGCASLLVSGDSPADPSAASASADQFDPAGPGAVFTTVEAAAADALVYAYLASRAQKNSLAAVRGGPIFPTQEGFSYDEPVSSSDGAMDRLRYRLGPEDVAHYRQFPASAGPGIISGAGKLVVSDRRVVDRRDPLGRPLFYLTPKRQMKVYLGAEAGERALGRIGFGVLPGDTVVELTRLSQAPSPMPLAAKDGMQSTNSSR